MKKLTFVIGTVLLMALFSSGKCRKDPIPCTIYGSISGTVRDKETLEPIEGARITLSPGIKSTMTKADGKYEFNNLDPKQYDISVQKIDYKSDGLKPTVVVCETTPGDIMLEKIK